MIEIIVAVWLVSFVLSQTVVVLNYTSIRRQLRSHKLSRLNHNLAKVGLFWSNAEGDVRPLTETAISDDARRTGRNALMLGLLGFLSLLGFLFLLLVIFSLRVLARSRKEVAAFHGSLASDETLTPEQVAQAVEALKQIN